MADKRKGRIWRSNYVKLPGININRSWKSDFHLLKVCYKANRILTILSRIFKFLILRKRRVLIKAHFESQRLVWMFHGSQINKINHLHERVLRIIYEDSSSFFDTLLEKDMSFSVHDRNIQQLALEMCKVTKALHQLLYQVYSCNVVIIDTKDHNQSFQFHR